MQSNKTQTTNPRYKTKRANDLVLALMYMKIPENGLDGVEITHWRKHQQTFDIRNLLMINFCNDSWINITKEFQLERMTLQHMNVDQICATYPRYRRRLEHLARLAYNPSLMPRDVYCIHQLVKNNSIGLLGLYLIRLLRNNNIQLWEYTDPHKIIGNCLLPEWILLIFMDQYGYGRCEALNHLYIQDFCDVNWRSSLSSLDSILSMNGKKQNK